MFAGSVVCWMNSTDFFFKFLSFLLLFVGGGGDGSPVLGLEHFENVSTHVIETAVVPSHCRNFVEC